MRERDVLQKLQPGASRSTSSLRPAMHSGQSPLSRSGARGPIRLPLLTASLPSRQSHRARAYSAEELLDKVSALYSAEDRDIFFALVDYCFELQTQVSALTVRLREEESNALVKRPVSSKRAPNPALVAMEECSTTGSLSRVVENIETKLAQIRQLFSSEDPLDTRFRAAATIQACARRRLVQNRYRRHRAALLTHRALRCQGVVELCMSIIGALQRRSIAVKVYQLKRFSTVVHRQFRAWKAVSARTAPRRRATQRAVEAKIRAKALALAAKTFAVLKLICMIRVRRQQAIQDRRRLREEVRLGLSEQLKARGETGVVSLDDLERALIIRVLHDFMAKKRGDCLRFVYDSLLSAVLDRRKSERKSDKLRFRLSVGKAFLAWSDWVYLVGVGLDRRRWRAARRYEVRYNQKKVDYFARKRLLRFALNPWRAYTVRVVTANSMFRKKLAAFLTTALLAWREVARRFRHRRIDAIDSWRGYARLVLHAPFQVWVKYSVVSHKRTFESEHRAQLYCRWKQRRFMTKVLRTWRHYALYGRIDGMYSRPVLLQSLREQKMQCARMMKVMASQTVQIESMSSSLEAEIQRRKKLEKSSKEAEEENRRGRMAAHHMQSEIGRLETIIEAMAIINPNQVQHLNQNQISFGFHDRSKAYDLDGKFDPYLTSSTYEGGLSVAESQPEPAKEAVAAAASALPTAAKVTVGTSTRDLAQTGDPEHTVMQWEKDQLKRVVWLLERFFVDAEADAKEELVYSAEESDADGSKGLRLAYHSLVKEEQLNSCSLLALLRDSMLFLKDGCTTGLSQQDRRLWTKLLIAKLSHKRTGEAFEMDAAALAGLEEDRSDPLHLDAMTWKTSLSALHTLSATSLSQESSIYSRMVDMRQNITDISLRHTGKHERRIAREDEEGEGAATVDETNVYAVNIKAVLKSDDDADPKDGVINAGADDSAELD